MSAALLNSEKATSGRFLNGCAGRGDANACTGGNFIQRLAASTFGSDLLGHNIEHRKLTLRHAERQFRRKRAGQGIEAPPVLGRFAVGNTAPLALRRKVALTALAYGFEHHRRRTDRNCVGLAQFFFAFMGKLTDKHCLMVCELALSPGCGSINNDVLQLGKGFKDPDEIE